MPGPVRVGVIGSSGKGDYGHGLDAAFQDLEGATLVAVADDNPAGRERVASRLGVDRSYADYGRMLKREKLDVVCVGPRWHNERVAMVTAAAEAGCHIYCEKPFAPTVEAADTMATAIRKAGVTLAMAHQWRAMAPVKRIIQQVAEGRFGRLLRVIARPKDDSRRRRGTSAAWNSPFRHHACNDRPAALGEWACPAGGSGRCQGGSSRSDRADWAGSSLTRHAAWSIDIVW